jgi:hypothetical protein
MNEPGDADLLVAARSVLLDALQALAPHLSAVVVIGARAIGLEAAIVDYAPMCIAALDPNDQRACRVNVASPAALLVAKLHKIAERADTPDRLDDKDAHDLYRLLVAIPTSQLAVALRRLRTDPLAGEVTRHAIDLLDELFAAGPDALGSTMAGRAEEGIGDPAVVSAATATLAADLAAALGQ